MKEKKFYQKPWFLIVAGIILLSIISGQGEDKAEEKETVEETLTETETIESVEEETIKETETQTIKETEVEEKVPAEFKNALKKAETYASYMYMSKQGIYDQLTSEYGENFPADAAQYAIDNLDWDYKENAYQKGKTYFETMNMSLSSVKEQLISEYGEQFTEEEAQYAIDRLSEEN